MRIRTITASRLALAVAVVAGAIALGRRGVVSHPDAARSRPGAEPAAPASTPLPTDRGGQAGNPFVDKTPPPDDEEPSGLDFRAYRYTTDQAIGLFQERARRNPNDFV